MAGSRIYRLPSYITYIALVIVDNKLTAAKQARKVIGFVAISLECLIKLLQNVIFFFVFLQVRRYLNKHILLTLLQVLCPIQLTVKAL